tara:strand:- start:512 stop:841 length:330 start_codon:yes stop_codon:yes gene_type:complete
MPDPKIKKTRRPVKKVVTNRKGKLLPNQTPVRRMTTIKKPVKKVLTPEQKAKLLALKKREERKKISAGRKPGVKTISKKKKLSPGEQERAARMSRRLAIKARIKRNSGN